VRVVIHHCMLTRTGGGKIEVVIAANVSVDRGM